MEKIVILFLVAFISLGNLSAQTNFQPDYEVSRMVDHYININKSTNFVAGWRIQLMATTDRRKMEEAQKDFMSKYPEVRVDWIHKKPYYKLLAGAYASKNEALPVLYKIKKDYPSAFPAKDNNIRPRELVDL